MHKRVLSLSKQAVQNQFKNTARCYASLPSEATAVTYSKYGDPTEVLKVEKVKLPEKLQSNQVLVQMQAAPINPADFNMIEGTYGRNPKLPAIVGNEGAGVVHAVGDQVTDLKVGDRVIPSKAAFGTWRTYAVAGADELLKVSSDIPLEYAATLGVNPSTAYRMLTDFASLKPGDVVVQNGASSMVGYAVVQIAKARGIKTINIVRDRPGNEMVTDRLKILGGDVVVNEKYANSAAMKSLIAEFPKAKLGLNCAGGPAARTVANLLGEGASLVTYGGMSRQPVSISTGSLIFKDLSLRGFWISRWMEQNSKEDRLKMINELSDLVKSKKLVFMMKTHKFSDFNVALKEAMEPAPANRAKIVLELQK